MKEVQYLPLENSAHVRRELERDKNTSEKGGKTSKAYIVAWIIISFCEKVLSKSLNLIIH